MTWTSANEIPKWHVHIVIPRYEQLLLDTIQSRIVGFQSTRICRLMHQIFRIRS